MRSAMSSTKSINLLLYIYSIARELNILIFSIYHFLDKKKLEKSSNYFLVSFPWKCIYKVKWIEQLYSDGKSRERYADEQLALVRIPCGVYTHSSPGISKSNRELADVAAAAGWSVLSDDDKRFQQQLLLHNMDENFWLVNCHPSKKVEKK